MEARTTKEGTISTLPKMSPQREHSAGTEPDDAPEPRKLIFINDLTKDPGSVRILSPVLSSTFITCRLNQSLINSLVTNLTISGCESLYFSEFIPKGRQKLESIMKTRNAWSQNLANLKNQKSVQEEIDLAVASGLTSTPPPSKSKPKLNSTKPRLTPNQKGILRRNNAGPASPNSAFIPRRQTRDRKHTKRVLLSPDAPSIYRYTHGFDVTSEDTESTEGEFEQLHAVEQESSEDYIHEGRMAQRPSLKLKLSTNTFNVQPPPSSAAQTPNPQSAVRTPSIKLNFGKKPSISLASTPIIEKDVSGSAPASGKKRKRTKTGDGSEDELAKPPPQRRLTLKTGAAPAKTPVTPGPVFRLKTKGKIPKRPLGVGYDSELEDREIDPVVLEGLVLRMQPGPDCDYIQSAIRDGTLGTIRAQGGADVRIRSLDTNGRRGVIYVNGHQYATTVVDLPCTIEGMKSWDKKGWIKSIDICQMMLVLGPCTSDEEAKNYPLPNDVDPKTFAYAHGLTAPMKWVRKRRFARTRRARVDDIESIERKVNALLEADTKALSSNFKVFDHDPRIEQDQYSEVEDDYEDEDAEGEEDDSYFPRQNGHLVETPGAMEVDVHVDQDQIDDIEAMFMDDDDDIAVPAANGHLVVKNVNPGLHPPNARDSSVAVTSASNSPSASAVVTAAPTPAGEAQPDSSDDEGDDDEDASDRSDTEKDADDNLQQVKDRIVDMENKIREQTELLRKTPNAILKKKLARKIGELRDDVRMMKVQNGLAAEEDGEDRDE